MATSTNYFSQHLRSKESQILISPSVLQKGMIIQCRYKNLDKKSKEYMFVVLNKSFRGKMHLLSLNSMSPKQLNDLARMTGVRWIPKYEKRGLDFEKLIMKESSSRFYHKKLAKGMDKDFNNSYRTFFVNKLSSVKLVDYLFDEDIENLLNG
tara:strand:+ start:3527 stop:3982 length:456 start_codon:yes stop_codon:yes gene_type:complete